MVPQNPSLSEVHESIDTTLPRKGWRRILAYFGPAYLVSVGYMDPGNWATDLQGVHSLDTNLFGFCYSVISWHFYYKV